MRWIVDKLISGESVEFKPSGHSMEPLVMNKQRVTIVPTKVAKVDDIVLCKVKGKYYLHKVLAIGIRGYLIGNNKGYINGWTHNIFGRKSP